MSKLDLDEGEKLLKAVIRSTLVSEVQEWDKWLDSHAAALIAGCRERDLLSVRVEELVIENLRLLSDLRTVKFAELEQTKLLAEVERLKTALDQSPGEGCVSIPGEPDEVEESHD